MSQMRSVTPSSKNDAFRIARECSQGPVLASISGISHAVGMQLQGRT